MGLQPFDQFYIAQLMESYFLTFQTTRGSVTTANTNLAFRCCPSITCSSATSGTPPTSDDTNCKVTSPLIVTSSCRQDRITLRDNTIRRCWVSEACRQPTPERSDCKCGREWWRQRGGWRNEVRLRGFNCRRVITSQRENYPPVTRYHHYHNHHHHFPLSLCLSWSLC